MKTIYIIAVIALMSSSAHAWEERTTCAHSRFYGTLSCRTVGIEDQRQARLFAMARSGVSGPNH